MGPHGPEVLTYELVRTVLRDDRFAMPKGLALAAQGITSGELWDISLKGLLSLDGAEHHRQRRLVSKAFTPRAAGRLRTTCADIIAELVDEHASTGRCDVVADIARQYRALEDYLDDMVTHRRDALTDDLLSDMMRAEMDGDRLAHDELLMLAATLLMAGTDTTRNQLAAAVQVFCDHPDQWALLAEHPALAPKAVEEAMRYSPIIFTTMRTAVEDVELAGVAIPAGTLVIANTAAANRDAAVYQDPDRFDITREDAPAVLTFGGGIHCCLGAHLARIELAEALTTMARRMLNIRVSGPVPWKSITGISGPASLPVEFTARP